MKLITLAVLTTMYFILVLFALWWAVRNLRRWVHSDESQPVWRCSRQQ